MSEATSIPLFPTGATGCDQLPAARVRRYRINVPVHADAEFVRSWIASHGWGGQYPASVRQGSRQLLLEKDGDRVRVALASPFNLIAASEISSSVLDGKRSHIHAIKGDRIVACTRMSVRAVESAEGTNLVCDVEVRSDGLAFRWLGRWIVRGDARLRQRELHRMAQQLEGEFGRGPILQSRMR